MIDLEKLRELAQSANTAEQWYSAHDMTSCSYDYDKAFIAECSPSVVLELLDRIAQLEKDAGRLDWLESSKESHGFCCVGYGEYRHYAHQEDGLKTVREVIDTAMEAKHG